jgi:hypothetical protein
VYARQYDSEQCVDDGLEVWIQQFTLLLITIQLNNRGGRQYNVNGACVCVCLMRVSVCQCVLTMLHMAVSAPSVVVSVWCWSRRWSSGLSCMKEARNSPWTSSSSSSASLSTSGMNDDDMGGDELR